MSPLETNAGFTSAYRTCAPRAFSAAYRVLGDAAAESPVDAVLRREDGRRALGAVADLPTPQREAVLLAYARGLSAAELAETSRVPLGTAKSRLRLGLEKAREALG